MSYNVDYSTSRFSLGFTPMDLIEESRESISLSEMDKENGTKIAEFIQSASPEILEKISFFCMEDPRLWELYWDVIYSAAVDVQILTRKESK
jgi:hypothetical protein